MSSATADFLEIRILSGTQRDAHCPVQDGDSLGSDTECDIVIADYSAPSARLHCSGQGWQILDETGTAESPLTTLGLARMLGSVWITVVWHSYPWVLEAVGAEQGEDGATEEDALAHGADPAVRAAGATAEAGSGGRRSYAWALGVLTLVLTALTGLAWFALGAPPAALQTSMPKTDRQLPLERVYQALTQLGLADRVQATATASGGVIVTGWLHDPAEQQRLMAALAAIRPRPVLNLTVHSEIPKVLAALLPQHAIIYRPDYGTAGQLDVRGISSDATQRVALLDALRERLPGIRILGQKIQLADDVRAELKNQLDAAGLPVLDPQWTARTLRVEASKLSQAERETLKVLMKQFNLGHFDVATIGGESGPGPMPFAIRSVVSGPAPFVILGDGSRLFVGGWHQQYRLSAIEERRLVFDRPRSLIVPR